MKVKDIMTREVVTVLPEASIEEIAKVLVENKISGVPVVDDVGNLVGIVSEGDLLHKEVSPQVPDIVNILGAFIFYNGVERYNEEVKKLMARSAEEIMTNKVVTIEEDMEVSKACELMMKHEIKRIPVMKEWKLVGIISRADVISTLINKSN